MSAKLINHEPSKTSAEHLSALEKAYADGNPLALHEALGVCRDHALSTPAWVADACQKLFVDFYLGNTSGTVGKGNSLLGDYKKRVTAYVRSRAYHTVRAWHKNPHHYVHMPRRLIILWFQDVVTWPEKAVVADALRHAHVGLQETAFQARMDAIRKAKSVKFPASLTFGRYDAEVSLGLRDELGIFGAPDIAPPSHVQNVLALHPKVEG